MKIFEKFNFTSKDEIIQPVKNGKIKLFFRIYQKFVRHNLVNKTLYLFIITIEYLQLLFELFYNGSDYIKNDNNLPVNASYYALSILQYLNFQHFLENNYITFNQYTLVFVITGVIVTLNFILCAILDYLNKNWMNKRDKLKFLHSILGLFNYLNLKIFLIPFNYVFFKSFFLSSWNTVVTPSNSSSTLALNPNPTIIIIFQIFGSIFILLNFFSVVYTGLLYNDIDPLNSKICWAQSYCEIEFFNIIIKYIIVVMNCVKGNFFYMKVVFVLIFNILKCLFRINEWYYSWQPNKIILTILEFKYLIFNILYPIFQDSMINSIPFIGIILLSIGCGVIITLQINKFHFGIIFKNVNCFTSEWQYCLMIIELIRIMKMLQNESKSITDSIFMGFLASHKNYCKNPYCSREVIISLIKDNQYEYKNEFETFTLTKNELNVYRKTNLRDNFDILTDQSKMKCQKIIFSIIKCIILKGLSKLKQPRLLSILEAFLYLHIFDNKFHALFQLMKYFSSDISHREKFFLFMTLSYVGEKMMEECSIKFSNNLNITTVTDYYFYHEEFLKNLSTILNNSKSYFVKLVSMKPTANEVLQITNNLGKAIKKLHRNFNKIMYMNPYEINILRIYAFLLDSSYFMKKLASFNINRLKNNIKYFLMNDKFKNNVDAQDSLSAKTALKSFQENSESAVLISSGNLENLGDILYCNNLITPILGYEKNQVQGFSINNIIPAPVSHHHNNLMKEFYKTGKSEVLDRITNVFALSKNGYLVNLELFLTYLPNMNLGLMFIALIKNSYTSIQKNINNLKTISYKTDDNAILILSKEFNIVHFNSYAAQYLGLPKGLSNTMPLYNISKICNNFHPNLSLLEKGDTVILNFETSELSELEYPSEAKVVKTSKDYGFKRKQTCLVINALDQDCFGYKEMAASMYRKEINYMNHHYFYLILQNKDKNHNELELSKEDEYLSMNEVMSIKTMDNISHQDEMKTINYDINFKKSSQMIKEDLLNNNYSPTFTKFANIIVLSLFICIIVWVIVAFVIELTTLQNISTLMEFISITKNLKNTVMYLVIDSLLLLRSKIYPFSNVNYLQPLIMNFLQQDSFTLNNLQQMFHMNSISSSTNFTDVFNQTSTYMELGLDKVLNRLNLNTMLGMNKFSTNFQYIMLYNYSLINSIDLSNFDDITELQIKLDFIYRNYNGNFFKIFDDLDINTASNLKSIIINKRNVLMIIFCVSILFCIVVMIILLFTVYKSESHKGSFLITLSEMEDLEIEKILLTLNLFIKSVESLNTEENNMHKIMQNLERNDKFFNDFIKTETFLNNNLHFDDDVTKNLKVSGFKNSIHELSHINEERSSLINNMEQDTSKKLLLSAIMIRKSNTSDLIELNGNEQKKNLLTETNTLNNINRIQIGNNNKRTSLNIVQTNKEIEMLKLKTETIAKKKRNSKNKNKNNNTSKQEKKDIKSYQNYKVKWSNSLFIILFTFVIVLSYFVLSISYLYSYISNITVMIDLSDVFNNRLTKTTNFLINLNFLIMYKAQFNNFNQTDYSEFINNNEKVYSSYMNGLSGSLYSNIILKNNDYELNNPCLTTDINVSYYLIDCNDYKIRNGLSFMILQINNYLVNIYNYFINNNQNNLQFTIFNDPGLIDNMNVDTFFLRVYLYDLYLTYNLCFTNEISNIFTNVLLKFCLYIFILFSFLIVFHSIYVPNISDELNNIKRSGLFLNNEMFEKFI